MGGASLVSSVLLARIYGVTVIGQYALILSVVLFTVVFSTLREQTALVRDLALFDPHDARISGGFYAVFCFSFALTVLVGGIAFLVASAIFRGALDQAGIVPAMGVALLSHLVFERISWTADSVLVSFRRAQELFWLRLMQLIFFSGLAVSFGIFAGYTSIMSLVLANSIAFGVFVLVRLVLVRRYMRFLVPASAIRDGFRRLPGYIRFGIRSIGISFAAVGRVAPTWVLASIGSIAQVGAYSRAEMITTRVTEGTWRVSEMLLPTLVDRRETGDSEGFDRSLIDTIRYMVIVLVALAASAGGSAIGVMGVFGPGFEEAATALSLLLLLPAINAITMCEKQALYAIDRPLAAGVIAIVELAFILVLSIGLGITFGTTGVATAMVISGVAAAVLFWKALRGHLQNGLMHYWSLRELLVVAAAYAAGFGVARLTDAASENHLITALAVALGALAYGIMFLCGGGLNARDKERIRRLLGPWGRRLRVDGFLV